MSKVKNKMIQKRIEHPELIPIILYLEKRYIDSGVIKTLEDNKWVVDWAETSQALGEEAIKLTITLKGVKM